MHNGLKNTPLKYLYLKVIVRTAIVLTAGGVGVPHFCGPVPTSMSTSGEYSGAAACPWHGRGAESEAARTAGDRTQAPKAAFQGPQPPSIPVPLSLPLFLPQGAPSQSTTPSAPVAQDPPPTTDPISASPHSTPAPPVAPVPRVPPVPPAPSIRCHCRPTNLA